jgi:hypothetical protein
MNKRQIKRNVLFISKASKEFLLKTILIDFILHIIKDAEKIQISLSKF